MKDKIIWINITMYTITTIAMYLLSIWPIGQWIVTLGLSLSVVGMVYCVVISWLPQFKKLSDLSLQIQPWAAHVAAGIASGIWVYINRGNTVNFILSILLVVGMVYTTYRKYKLSVG